MELVERLRRERNERANQRLVAEYQELHTSKSFDTEQLALILDVVAFVTNRRPDEVEITGNLLESMQQSSDERSHQWNARFDRLNTVLGDYRVPFLRACLKDATGLRWNDAKSDELMHAADSIITGTDEAKKAKLLDAARKYK